MATTPGIRSAMKHSAVVRVTHWATAIFFACLLLSGIEILISHPRFYWGVSGVNYFVRSATIISPGVLNVGLAR